ncbi:MAG: NUDIX hydrolase [candidate division Zixibacteria bacterium SM23_81]|nr:MAG: NUDIX hydrolase [candidate division Zixibacteria bacterium SM23_81]
MSRREDRLRLRDIDWQNWKPQQRATLVFVIRDGQVLLIRKRKGLGVGKINAPGGRIGSGETPLEGAVREAQEELCVIPVGIRQMGELRFQFVDGLSLHVYVFVAKDCVGSPQETDEAEPIWTPIDAIPYEQMWEDDSHWVPVMLSGRTFDGRFVFDGDQMLDFDLRFGDSRVGPLESSNP